MIPVETVLRRLIVEFEFVILPGFGALLCHHIPASYDTESSVFSPPVKKLAFNEFLKLDDGLLANFISRHERIPHQEAVAYIKDYIDKLWAHLESKGEARIMGIGTFNKNVEGKLVFDPGAESHFKDEWYGFKSINARLASSIHRPRILTGREKELVEETVEILEDEADHGIKWWRWSAAAAIICVLGYFSFFFVSNNLENKSSLNPFGALFERTENKLPEVKSPEVEPVTVEVLAPSERAVSTDSLIVDSTDGADAKGVDDVVSLPEVSIQKDDLYFVIAGAFKGSRQATVLLEQMKEKGYDNTILIPADANNSKVKVAVESFASEADAHAASKKLKDVIGEIGWVYKQKGAN